MNTEGKHQGGSGHGTVCVATITAHINCGGRGYRVVLDAGRIRTVVVNRARRKELMEQGVFPPEGCAEPRVHCCDPGVREDLMASDAVLEVAEEPELEASSGDCFCFETDLGDWYCICGPRGPYV